MIRPSAGETLRAWLLSALVVHGAVAGNPDAKRLYDDLLSNYNKLVRPVVNTSDVLRVCIKLKLSQLIDVIVKKIMVSTTKNEMQKRQFPDYPIREKRKYHSKLESIEELLNFPEKYKSESQGYHVHDYPQFMTMSHWTTLSQNSDKCSSHSYELPSKPELSNGFSEQRGKKKKKPLKSKRDIVSFWSNDSQMPRTDKNEMGFGRLCPFSSYKNSNEGVHSSMMYDLFPEDSKEKYEKKSALEGGDYKSKLIFNSSKEKSAKRKKSNISYILKSKRKNHKVNRLEAFSKRFKNVDSMKEFKNVLENFGIIDDEELDKSSTDSCKEYKHIFPAFFVLKLARNSRKNLIKKKQNELGTSQSLKLIFEKDDSQNDSEEKPKDCLAFFKSSAVIEMRDESNQTSDINDDFIEGDNPKDSKIKFYNKKARKMQKYCPDYAKMEENYKFQSDFNKTLLEQVKTIATHLSTMIGLFNDLIKSKNENNNNLKSELIKEFFARDLYKVKEPCKKIISKEDVEKSPDFPGTYPLHKNVQNVYLGEGFNGNYDHWNFLRNDFENISKDVCTLFPRRKHKDVFYLPQDESDRIIKKQLERKNESSDFDVTSKCCYEIKHCCGERKGIIKRTKKYETEHLKKELLGKNANSNDRSIGEEDERIRKKDLNEEEDEDTDYEDSGNDSEDDGDKRKIITVGDVKKLEKKENTQKRGKMKKLKNDQVRPSLEEANYELSENDALSYSNEENANRLSSRASSKLNLKNQIMTTNLWVEQSWYDYKLRWDPKEYGGVHMLHVPSDHIWRPDIVLYNNADGNYEVTLMTKARVSHTGLVEWQPPAVYKSSCAIDVEFFPYDIQTCVLKLGSWTYDGFKVDLRHMDEKAGSNVVEVGVDLSEFYMSVEWDILEVPAVRNEKFYTCCDEPYLDITFNITMRRKTLFYTVNIIIPCMGISFLTVLTFYLPSDSGEKVTLSISILISLHVFFLLVVEIIPPTSLVVPLLGKYLIFAMILVSISICVTVVVLNVHFRSPQTHRMAPWVKRVFIHILPRLLVMRRPQYHFEPHRFMSRRVIMQTVKGKEIQTSYYSYPYQTSAPAENPKVRDIGGILPRQRTLSKEDFSPESLADGEPVFGGSCQIHGPPPQSESEELSLSGVEGGLNDGEDLKSPTINNPAFSHSLCPPEVHKSCFCVRFIAEHTKMLEDSTKVKEDWKYVAMVLDRLFLWIFTLAVLVGTAGIILQAPTLYDDRIPIDKQFAEIQTSTVIRCPPQ